MYQQRYYCRRSNDRQLHCHPVTEWLNKCMNEWMNEWMCIPTPFVTCVLFRLCISKGFTWVYVSSSDEQATASTRIHTGKRVSPVFYKLHKYRDISTSKFTVTKLGKISHALYISTSNHNQVFRWILDRRLNGKDLIGWMGRSVQKGRG